MKWLRLASKNTPVVDENTAAPLIVEAKGERAKIRELRERLEKEDKASEIKALSDAIDALESRMEKDQARKEKRKKDKTDKAAVKPAAAEEPVKEVEAAGRRKPAPGFAGDDQNDAHDEIIGPELGEELLSDPFMNANEVGDDSADNEHGIHGEIVSVEMADEGSGGKMLIDVDSASGKVVSVSYSDDDGMHQMSPEDVALLVDDADFMAEVNALVDQKSMHLEPALPAALIDQMTAVADLVTAGNYVGEPDLLLQLQAQLESLGGRHPAAAETIGGLYNALELGYRELMEIRSTRIAADDEDAKENDMPPKDKKDDEPKKDSKAPEKKDDGKKAPPFGKKEEPQKKPAGGDEHHDEADDINEADEAIEKIRDLIKKEHGEGEGGAHVADLEKALQLLERFIGGEEGEEDMFKSKPAMPPAPPASKAPPKMQPGAPMKMEILPPGGGSPSTGTPPQQMKGMSAKAANPKVVDEMMQEEKDLADEGFSGSQLHDMSVSPHNPEDPDEGSWVTEPQLIDMLSTIYQGIRDKHDMEPTTAFNVAIELLREKGIDISDDDIKDLHEAVVGTGQDMVIEPAGEEISMSEKQHIEPDTMPEKHEPAQEHESAQENPWIIENKSGLEIGSRVWRKAMTGSMEYVGDESGRVVAVAGDKVVVDWGDDELLDMSAADLTVVQAAEGEDDVFVQTPDLTMANTDEAAVEERTAEEEAAAILSTLSLKDMLSKAAAESAADVEGAIVHLVSGKVGKFVAQGSDGRVTINIDGRELSVYAYEIAPADTSGEGLF